jgi:hypothetical protein
MTERFDRELDLKAIVGFAVGLVLFTTAASGLLWYFAKFLRGHEEAKDPPPPALTSARAPFSPPLPRLQTDPARDIAELRAAEDAVLDSYGWVDRESAVARIPIERAISLMVGDAGPAAAVAAAPAVEDVP